jgi:RNA polymerase sigma factor (sigma-70 family)
MRERTDSELVAATLAGERTAFGELIDRHRPRAVRLARRLLRDPLEAEDVVQEALLQTFLRLEELREPDRFGAWLCGIAANLAKMRLRASARGLASLEELAGGMRAPPGVLAAPDPSPEQAAETRELLRLVLAAIDALPGGQRDVVLMHYVEGLSCQEIAALLGRSTGAVRVRLHRARRELRALLGAAHPETETTVAAGGPRKEHRAMIEVTLEDVVVRVEANGGDLPRVIHPLCIVLLRERDGDRLLPIWIGAPEGDALAVHRGGVATPRPLTIDLTLRMLELADARLERVHVSSLRDNTFYAVIGLRVGDAVHEVDARPSDALNLAVRVGAPITVDARVMEEAGIATSDTFRALDEEREKHGVQEEQPGEWRSLSPALALRPWAPPTPPGK